MTLKFTSAWTGKFTPMTLRITLKVIGSARSIRLSKCWILSIISIFDLEMTFKDTSGQTGSRIFRLPMVDIPIQCLTSVTLGRQIRVLHTWAGPVYVRNGENGCLYYKLKLGKNIFSKIRRKSGMRPTRLTPANFVNTQWVPSGKLYPDAVRCTQPSQWTLIAFHKIACSA